MNWKGCAGCGDVVLESEAVTSTRRIGESDGVEYRCYECDPWADSTGYGAWNLATVEDWT